MEERIVLQADRNLYFPAVERFRQALSRVSHGGGTDSSRMIVIDMSRVTQVDHTSLKVISSRRAAGS